MDQPNTVTTFSEKIIDAIIKYKNAILGVIAIVLVGSAGFYGWSYFAQQKELKAMEAYSAGEKLYQAGLGAADFANSQDPKAPKTQVDQSLAIAKFEDVIAKHPNTKARQLAAFRLSEIYFAQNNSDKVIEVLEPVIQNTNFKDLMAGLIGLRLTGIYERAQKCDKALPILEKISAQNYHPLLKPEAYLRTGLCFEALNQKDKAIEIYKKLTQEFSNSLQSQQAQKYLKIINS